MKTSFRPGLKFRKYQVNGRVSGLHCTWLVPRTRDSSDNVDGFLTLRMDPLEEGRSTEGVAQSVFTWTSHHALRWDSHLVESQEGLETEVGPRTDLISSGRSGAQQATEVLGQEFLDQISPEGHMFMFYLS
ncbi:hypothetical protein M9H77_30003 [Catharanthus roseus]|uniref:Uncharacterized protein n=1 Tax=Catharanthus roseus TaxID=4058 RepID=A0ACB9ZZX5_CATRO|nr:hypothetical protein M9H77_30003 [Catharanthus roseus]